MKRLIIITALLLSFLAARPQSDHYISPTKYDWSGLAGPIVAGKTSNYDKFYAIYRWLCDNIAYDTSYTIHTADECYEQQRGVCQAYSEMFYRIAEAVGLKVDIVSGYTKTNGVIDPDGHAWIFAYTDPAKGTGILIDPTWGAGSVNGSVFTRSHNDDSWFHVSPSWMIFTHLPKDDSYQLLGGKTVSRETFLNMPDHKPALSLFGFDGGEILKAELAGRRIVLPTCYESTRADFGVERAQIPSSKHLSVGTPITLALKTKLPVENVIMIGDGCGPYFNKGQWQRQGEYLYCRFVPARKGDVNIGILNRQGTYTTLAAYEVQDPSAADIAKLEAEDPALSPIWEQYPDCRPEFMLEKGVDLSDMLKDVRANGYKTLPTFYTGTEYKVNNIPYNGTLKVGQTYVFEITPPRGAQCAVIVGDQNKDWYREWYTDDRTGIYRIEMTPKQEGNLQVAIKGNDNSYHGCFQYKVRY